MSGFKHREFMIHNRKSLAPSAEDTLSLVEVKDPLDPHAV